MSAWRRQTTGSVICPACGKLVGVKDERCWNCGRRSPGMWGFAAALRGLGLQVGFTQIVIFSCALLYVLMLIADPSSIGFGGLINLLSPSSRSVFLFGGGGALPVVGVGRWWTLLSAGWLHGSLLHIAFNMMWAYQLIPAVSRLYGTSRVIIIYVLSSVVGFAASSLAIYLPLRVPFLEPARLTLGASAAILGLLGSMVYYGRRTGSSMLGRQAAGYAAMLIVFGFVMRGVDNWAHVGGFVGGYLVARWLDPLKRERADHSILALALLVATVVSIVLSVVLGLSVARELSASGYL